MEKDIATNQTILVIGGGIAGISAALEAAECGRQVILAERNALLGGRTLQLYRYFPKMCHPTCGLEINLRRIKANRNLRVLTMTEVVGVSGRRGSYRVKMKIHPRHVNEKCTACGECASAVSSEIPNRLDYGLGKTRAAYLPHAMAYPMRYVIDPSIVGTEEGRRAKEACRVGAVDLEMKEETIEIEAGSVIWATGWKPYDASKIQPYGYGRLANVITSVEFERLADPAGPSGGRLVRPSDGKEAKNVAFIQCAGSRDENHLRHCSRICCMASLKQTRYVSEASDAKSTVYYIDIRAIDRFEDFYRKVQEDPSVNFVKSKVASISLDESSGDLILNGVDTEGYHRYANRHDLVVLAVGMEPELGMDLPEDVVTDSSGFIEGGYAAGAASSPLDVNRSVQSATSAALFAISDIHRISATEDAS